ncbi:PKD domain-containing protein [Granulosicoccaceae sp. 1_MG-2023]|nr:PKD domain-containing protein [Granulosicoccaceae sp. 1_MG-2023]
MRLFTSTVLLVSSISLTACGGSSGGSDDAITDDANNSGLTLDDAAEAENTAPQVRLAVEAYGIAGEAVSLRASVEDDGLPDGELSYRWYAEDDAGVSFYPDDEAATSVVFQTAGEYTVTLEVSDGELSATDSTVVTVEASTVNTSGLAGDEAEEEAVEEEAVEEEAVEEEAVEEEAVEEEAVEEDAGESATDAADSTQDIGELNHSSGMSLKFDPDAISLGQADLDWMYNVWSGMTACLNAGSDVALPQVLVLDGLDAAEGYDVDAERVKVSVSDILYSTGASQGLSLAKGFTQYIDNYGSQALQDPLGGLTCYDWHSGGRHNPPPGRSLSPAADNPVSLTSLSWLGSSDGATLSADGVSLSDGEATTLQTLAETVLGCNTTHDFDLDELRVVPAGSDFEGDYWDEAGALDVDERTVLIGYDGSGMSSDWKQGVFDLLNRYAAAAADRQVSAYECQNANSIAAYNGVSPVDP